MASDEKSTGYRFNRDFLDRLTSSVDGPSLVQRYVKLTTSNGRHLGLCPFHQDSKPSFYVRDDGSFYCFGCQKKGSVFNFLMEMSNLSFTQAVEEVAQFAGVALPQRRQSTGPTPEQQELYDLLERCVVFFEEQLKSAGSNSPVKRYLEQRGLSDQVIEDFRIGFAPNSWSALKDHFSETPIELLIKADVVVNNQERNRTYDRYRNRLMFPIRNRNGYFVGFGGRTLDETDPKYLNTKQTPVFHKSRELYGLYESLKSSRRKPRLLLTEGYMDVVSLSQFGIDFALATLGTATNKEHFRQAFWFTSEVVCCFDGDEAGRKAASRALEVVLPELDENRDIRFMFLPEGEDPDSLIRTKGVEHFEQLVDESQHLADYFVSVVHESKDRSFKSVESKLRFVRRARELLNSIKSESLRNIVRIEIAKCFDDDESVVELLDQKPAEVSGTPPIQRESKKPRTSSGAALVNSNLMDLQRQQHRCNELINNPGIWPSLRDHANLLEQVAKLDPDNLVVLVWQAIYDNEYTDPEAVIAHFSDTQGLAALLSQMWRTAKGKSALPKEEALPLFLDTIRAHITICEKNVKQEAFYKEGPN